MDIENIRGALARGYCEEGQTEKVMDRHMVSYEWDIETVDLTAGSLHSNEADIIDHEFFEKCPGIPQENDQRLVLVRDSDRDGRLWSYQTPKGDMIDPWMRDAYGTAVAKVPVKYLKEFASTK